MRLENRVGIVTGAGRNIGEAVAGSFADEGARVAVADVDPDRAQAVADAINKSRPDRALPIVCDVSISAEVQRMVRQVVDRWGRIDILVNNAAVTDHKSVLDLGEEEWDQVLDVTLKSVFLCSKYAAKRMVEQGGGGRIINMASTSGHRGRGEATAYTAAKGGVLNLTRSLAVQLAPYGIRVNSVTPNQIGSPVGLDYIPERRRVTNLVGRQGMPPDIAAAVVFLASADADFMTAADLLVDGGALASPQPFSTERK
jgi:NAD(P)-dependent dehydrogenase (short-subunit alcohol dehydrogenase family)